MSILTDLGYTNSEVLSKISGSTLVYLEANHDVDMLKNNRQTYDENVIKALLYGLSLFPIGGYVYLSDGKLAQVVDVNPENPKNPIVQTVPTNKNTEPETIHTSETGIKIVRALSKDEADDVKRNLREME